MRCFKAKSEGMSISLKFEGEVVLSFEVSAQDLARDLAPSAAAVVFCS